MAIRISVSVMPDRCRAAGGQCLGVQTPTMTRGRPSTAPLMPPPRYGRLALYDHGGLCVAVLDLRSNGRRVDPADLAGAM